MQRWIVIPLIVFFTTGAMGVERAFLPRVELLSDDFLEVSETQRISVDHDPWDRFLETYVATDGTGVNRVDYAGVTAADNQALDDYLLSLQAIDPADLTRDQQLAFWINLYNAKTVDLILDNYPVESIRDIKQGFLSLSPWDRKVLDIGGFRLTLNVVVHRIIRPIYDEPRIHYALNCAAESCPNLATRAWRAATLDADLTVAEKAYVNDPRGVRIDDEAMLVLSKIYGWFREDFGRNEAAVLERLTAFAEPPLNAKLAGRTSVDRYEYDWSLNDRISDE
ncbi:MAG: DUF547 domain-containing protein [Pseudomonadota bacterium]